MTTKTKIIAAIITLGLILITLFMSGLGGRPIGVTENKQPPQNSTNDPAIVSSDPKEVFLKKPLVVPPSQVIKLNFSVPLQNAPETRITIEPTHDIEIKLEDYDKTAVITPKTPYKLGQGYTIFVKQETKLKEEGKTLGRGYDFHFNVINYSGI